MKIMLEVDKASGNIAIHADLLRRVDRYQYSVVGAGRIDNRWVDERTDLAKELLSEALSNPSAFSLRISGGLLLSVVEPDRRRAVMVNDPLGAATMLAFETENHWLAASDIEMIVGRARELGFDLSRDPRSLGSMLVTGVTGMGWSPYRDVRIISILTVLDLERGVLTERKVDFLSILRRTRALDFEENLEVAKRDIGSNIRAFSQADRSWKVAHLTGGFDSRLVLSFLLAERVEGDFVFACHGRSVERDREVFEFLASELSLKVAPSRYLSISEMPQSFEEELIGPLDFSRGMSLAGPSRYSLSQDGLVLSGGYGEFLRSSYWREEYDPVIKDSEDLLLFLYGNNIGSFGGDLLESDFLSEQATVLWNIYLDGLNLGLSSAGAIEYVYLHRNRMFVGQQSHLYRSIITRVDPLYSIHTAAWGLTMSNEDRKSNRAGIELMLANSPLLLELPFDSERLSHEQRIKYNVETSNRRDMKSSKPLCFSPIPTEPMWSAPSKYMPSPTAEQVDFAREKKASLRQVVWAEHVRSRLRLLIQSSKPDSVFNDVFNVHQLSGILSRPFSNRVVIRSMINIYALMLWYSQ